MTQDVLPADANTAGIDEVAKLKLEKEKLQEQLSTMLAEKSNNAMQQTEYEKAVAEKQDAKDLESIENTISVKMKETDFLVDSIKSRLCDSSDAIDQALVETITQEMQAGYKRDELIERLKFLYIHTFLRDESFEGDDDLSIPLKKVLENKQYIPSISKEVNKLYLPAKGIANKSLRAKNVSTHEKKLGKIDSNSDLDMSNPVHVHLAFSRGKIKAEEYDLFRKNLKKRG